MIKEANQISLIYLIRHPVEFGRGEVFELGKVRVGLPDAMGPMHSTSLEREATYIPKHHFETS